MRTRLNQSVGIMQVFVSLGAGAMSNSLFASSTEWFQVLITNLPIIFLGIVGMGGIAFAVFQSSFR